MEEENLVVQYQYDINLTEHLIVIFAFNDADKYYQFICPTLLLSTEIMYIPKVVSKKKRTVGEYDLVWSCGTQQPVSKVSLKTVWVDMCSCLPVTFT